MASKKNKKNKNGKPNFLDLILILAYAVLAVVMMVLFSKLSVLTDTLFTVACCVLAFIFLLLVLMAFLGKKSRMAERILAILLIIVLAIGVSVEAKAYETFKKITEPTEGQVTVSIYVKNNSSYESLSDLEGVRLGYQNLVGSGNIQKAISDARTEIWFDYLREYSSNLDLVTALFNDEIDCIVVEKALVGTIDGYSQEQDNENLPVFSENARSVASFVFDEQADVQESGGEEEKYVSNFAEDSFCVYLSGVDSRSGNLDKSNSDTNLVAVINPKTHTVLLLSTPRDFYVDFVIPGKTPWRDKLTHAGIFGTSGVMSTLGNLYGIDNIHNYAKINFTGITDLVDALGGITIENPYAFTTYWTKVHFPAGPLTLDGENALVYARERYTLPGGDRARGEHQMLIIKAILNKIVSNPSVLLNYSELLNVLGNNFNTNISIADIGSLVQLELNGFPKWKIYSYAPSGSDSSGICPSYSNSKILYVMEPNWDQVNKAKQYVQTVMDGGEITDLQPTIVG